MQRRNARRSGPGRALHRKGHVGVRASFEVTQDFLLIQSATALFRSPEERGAAAEPDGSETF